MEKPQQSASVMPQVAYEDATVLGIRKGQAIEVLTVLTVKETAAFLRVSESIIRRLIREKRIPYFQIEGRYLFYRPALEDWIRGLVVPVNGTRTETVGSVANDIWEKVKKS